MAASLENRFDFHTQNELVAQTVLRELSDSLVAHPDQPLGPHSEAVLLAGTELLVATGLLLDEEE